MIDTPKKMYEIAKAFLSILDENILLDRNPFNEDDRNKLKDSVIDYISSSEKYRDEVYKSMIDELKSDKVIGHK